MKKLLFLLLLGIPSFASITQVQGVGSLSTNCGLTTGTSCASGTLTAIGAGHLIVVAHYNTQTSGTAVSTAVCGGDTLTNSVAGSLANANGSVSLWYILSATGGATSCNLTLTVSNSGKGIVVYEFSSSLTTPTFTVDSGATPAATNFSATACTAPTACVGVNLTIAGSNDVIVQEFNNTLATGVSSPWSSLIQLQTAAGGRYATSNINTSSGTGPTYTNSSSTNIFTNGAAFTENGSGGGGSFKANQSVFAVGP